MAHIIDLACDITEVRSRYLKIHDAVFGLSLRRSAYLIGRGTSAFYGDRERELCALEEQLVKLESVLAQVDSDELTRRAGRQVHAALMEYTSRLATTVIHLKEICGKLSLDEAEYRRLADNGDSRFRRDKIRYDCSVQELRRRGAKMNELFSTF